MKDPRSFEEIRQAHPMPWVFKIAPGLDHNGMARIVAFDAAGAEVVLAVLIRVIDIVTTRAASAQQPTPAT